jgi:hypothetical protein
MSGLCFEVPPTSRAKIEALTTSIRQHFRVTDPFYPLIETVELWLPRVWQEFEFTLGDYAEMGEDHGRTFPGQHHIRLRSDVYDNLRQHRGRDRFTLGHELGHVFMHDDPALARNVRRREEIPPFRSSEWQANSFSGSLLMPLDFLKSARSIGEVVECCGVTIEAATTQVRGMTNAGLLRNPNLG